MVNKKISKEIDDYFPFDSYRLNQKEILLKSLQDLKDGKDVVIIEGPTGFGKSAINIGIANYFNEDKTFYTSPQVKLVKQLTEDFGPDNLVIDGGEGDIIPLLGRGNYTCRETGKACNICDIYLDKDRSCRGQQHCTYMAQKKAAKKAQTIILTFAKLVVDTYANESLGNRRILIVDEAHSLEEQTASLFCGFTVSPYTIPDAVWEKVHPKMPNSENIEPFSPWLWEVEERCVDYRLDEKCTSEGESQIEDMVRKLSYLNKEMSEGRNWVVNLDKVSYRNEQVKRPKFKPIRVDKFLQRMIWDRGEHVVLSTATVPFRDKPEKWLKRIGLEDAEFSYHSAPMNFLVQNRPVITSTMGGKMTKSKENENWVENVKTVKMILREHRGERGLIHTQSYSRARELDEELDRYSTYLHRKELDRTVIEEWRESNSDILLSPALKEGVDLKDDLCRYQILFKVPYPSLRDNRVSYLLKEEGEEDWYHQETAKYVIQSYGRAIRSPEDSAKFYIIDGSFNKLILQTPETFPSWFGEAMKYGEEKYDDFSDKREGKVTPYERWASSTGELSNDDILKRMKKRDRGVKDER